MTTSIFSKLSQQSKHRDLLENADPDAPPIGNPKTGKTIADFREMGLDIRMICSTCRTSGPLDVSDLPKGADTESRIAAARCPSCGSEAVSQEIVPLGSVSGPVFAGFVRVPRVASPRSYPHSRPSRAEVLPEDDLPADLLPILEKEIVKDHDLPECTETEETDKGAMNAPTPTAPAKTSAKTPTKPTAKTPAQASITAPVRPSAKTPPKAPAKAPTKASAKTSTKTAAKTSPARASTKAPVKAPAKTPPKAPAKAPAKAFPKTSTKTAAKTSPARASTKAPAKALARTSSKAPAKTSTKTTVKTPARAPARTASKAPTKAPAKTSAKSRKGSAR